MIDRSSEPVQELVAFLQRLSDEIDDILDRITHLMEQVIGHAGEDKPLIVVAVTSTLIGSFNVIRMGLTSLLIGLEATSADLGTGSELKSNTTLLRDLKVEPGKVN